MTAPKSRKGVGGRPTDYKKSYPAQAEKLCALGATDIEIADFFEVDIRTVYRWKLKHEQFCHALKTGKEAADARVERSLYQKAVGFYFVEQQVLKVKRDQNLEEIEIVDVTRHHPADPTSAIFWLKNRQPEKWRDRKELTGKDGGPIEMSFAEALEARQKTIREELGEKEGE